MAGAYFCVDNTVYIRKLIRDEESAVLMTSHIRA